MILTSINRKSCRCQLTRWYVKWSAWYLFYFVLISLVLYKGNLFYRQLYISLSLIITGVLLILNFLYEYNITKLKTSWITRNICWKFYKESYVTWYELCWILYCRIRQYYCFLSKSWSAWYIEFPILCYTTGPLGQGVANAVGLALAEANLNARYNKPDVAVVDHRT